MKYKILFSLAFQTIVYNILIHHSVLLNYNFNLLSLASEFMHFFISFLIIQVHHIKMQKWNIMIMPSILYFIQHVTRYYGMTMLDPSLYQFLFQINLIFSAIISPKKLNLRQNICIIFLFFGICIVLFNRHDINVLRTHSHLKGIFFTILAAATHAITSRYVETILKSEKDSIWCRHLQLSSFGVLCSSVSCVIDNEHLHHDIPASIMILVGIKCLGDIILPFALKYTDNVTTSISHSIAAMIALILSHNLYHWRPHNGFYIGSFMIVSAVYFFHVSDV